MVIIDSAGQPLYPAPAPTGRERPHIATRYFPGPLKDFQAFAEKKS